MATPRDNSYSVASGRGVYAGVGGPPAWRDGMAVGEWREIGGTVCMDLAPTNTVIQTNGKPDIHGPVSRMDSWCGLSIDTRDSTVYAAANGGHGDYFGNEVIACRLEVDAPAWEELHAGSDGYVADTETSATHRSHARYLDSDGARPWAASTVYDFSTNARRVQNGAGVYHLVTAGTSASSGGPTGTGSSIADGSCVWSYVGPTSVHAAGVAGTGLPCSTHSYSGQQFIESHSRAIRLGGSTSPVGSAFENVEAFDVVGLAWDNYNANTEAPPYGYCLGGSNNGWFGSALGWPSCKDPVTERVFVVSQSYLRMMTPAGTPGSGTWVNAAKTPWNPTAYTGAYGAMAVDTLRNRVFWAMGSAVGIDIAYWDLDSLPANPDAGGAYKGTSTTFPASDAATAMKAVTALAGGAANAAESSGCVYEPTLDAYLIRQGAAGSLVYKIDAETFEVSELSTTGGASVPAAHSFVDQQGIFNRWLYAPNLQGIVYFPLATADAWFLRTH